ncbi:MAG: cytochrome P450 [Flavobacteriales bacterium]|nr:cytochrome P450 [Flavobacteriales bacterium]
MIVSNIDIFASDFYQRYFDFYPKFHQSDDILFFEKSNCYAAFKFNIVKDILKNKDSFSSKYYHQHDRILLGADGPSHTWAKKVLFQNLSYLQANDAENYLSDSSRLMSKLMEKVLSNEKMEVNAIDYIVDPYLANVVLTEFGLLNQYPSIDILSDETSHESKIILIRNIFKGTLIEDISKYSVTGGSISPDLQNVLSEFLKNDSLDEDDLIKFMKVFTQAEMFTTSSLLASCLYFMNRLDSNNVLDDGYLELFINEVLRIYSPSQLTLRHVEKDTIIGNVMLPEGSMVAVFFGAANRDEQVFQNASEFRLDRTEKHIAFGLGAHKCIGERVAMERAKKFIKLIHPYYNQFSFTQNPTNENSVHIYKIDQLGMRKR